jgi:UDP-N-acetylglucosamine diphosphorylase/glucosamine-1-phosphate N-acetyltransferase
LQQTTRPLATVILAAGQGKRMQDPTKPKVLYQLAGKQLVSYVIELAEKVGSAKTIVIIGFGREQVTEFLTKKFPEVSTAVQAEQLGTGHAVMQTESLLKNFSGDVLVLSGDVPLLSLETTRKLIETHRASNALATVLSVVMPEPTGYGRIVRSADGLSLAGIVEEKDASTEIRKIREINSGIYVFDAKTLFPMLKGLRKENAQGEYYLTDIFFEIVAAFGPSSVAISTTSDVAEVTGINTKLQLIQLEGLYLRKALNN